MSYWPTDHEPQAFQPRTVERHCCRCFDPFDQIVEGAYQLHVLCPRCWETAVQTQGRIGDRRDQEKRSA